MQKVPHIHIFGSSGQDWRKRSPQKYKKEFADTWTSSNAWGEFRKPYKQSGYDSQLYYRTMRRSNSARRLMNSTQKPFGRDYYANAMKICDDNRLRNIIGHDIEHFNSPYLVKGCRRTLKSECEHCKEQARINKLKKESNSSSKIMHKSYSNAYLLNNNPKQYQHNAHVQYIMQQQQPLMNSYTIIHPQQQQQQQQVVNGPFVVKTINNNISNNSSNTKPIVSFQYAANGSNEVRYPTFRVMEKQELNQQQLQLQQPLPQFRQLTVTEKNLIQQHNNNSYVNNNNTNTINGYNKLIALGPSKRQQQQPSTFTTISRTQQQSHYLLPQISGLINQLEVTSEQGESEKTKIMLDQLEQAARKELLVRQRCINKLDDLIEEYGQEVVQQKYQKQQTVIKTRSAFFC